MSVIGLKRLEPIYVAFGFVVEQRSSIKYFASARHCTLVEVSANFRYLSAAFQSLYSKRGDDSWN
jgi:hypothetical protein